MLMLAGVINVPVGQRSAMRLGRAIKLLDDQLAKNTFLIGEELSAADVMSVFSLTTMRGFYPKLDLTPYNNVLRYLADIAKRPAYKKALERGDKGMEPMITPTVKCFTQFPGFRMASELE